MSLLKTPNHSRAFGWIVPASVSVILPLLFIVVAGGIFIAMAIGVGLYKRHVRLTLPGGYRISEVSDSQHIIADPKSSIVIVEEHIVSWRVESGRYVVGRREQGDWFLLDTRNGAVRFAASHVAIDKLLTGPFKTKRGNDGWSLLISGDLETISFRDLRTGGWRTIPRNRLPGLIDCLLKSIGGGALDESGGHAVHYAFRLTSSTGEQLMLGVSEDGKILDVSKEGDLQTFRCDARANEWKAILEAAIHSEREAVLAN